MNKDYAQEVAQRLIEQLKQGTAPWQKPWKPGELRLPYNAVTGKEYRGMNSIWLHAQGYSDPRWMTYKQAQAVGAQVRKGAKGTRILYWKFTEERNKVDEHGNPVLDEQGKPIKETVELERPRVFMAVVFNAQQIDGLPPLEAKPLGPEPERHARAEAILANSGAKIEHVPGDRAFYRSSTDMITLPMRNQFHSADAYYATALHELGHWTGHPSRLNRDLSHPFGSEGYAREELRAEIASLMLGERLEIGHDPGQHAAYVASWIKVLSDDPREIFRATADAEKIAAYVMDLEHQKVQEQTQTQTQTQERRAVLHEPPEANSMTPNRTYLVIPYREKDAAKKTAQEAGFRLYWDKDAKCWYAPEGVDVRATPLAQYLPENVRTVVPRERQLSPEESFAAAIRAAGLELDGLPVMDGRLHRVPVAGDKGAERSGAYAGHLEGRVPGGFIQNHRTGQRINWKYEGRVASLDDAERERLRQEAAERAARRAAEVAAQHEATAKIAEAMWKEAPPASPDHPYCRAKGIMQPGENGVRVVPSTVSEAAKAAGVRVAQNVREAKAMREAEPHARVFLAGDLLIPARDADGKLWSLQSVNPHFKGFMRDGRKAGLFTVAGSTPESYAAALERDPNMPIVIAEGYATADTVARLRGHPVVVAFDSGNLDAVARTLRERYPDRTLLIAADNDHKHEAERGNVGLEKAKAAAERHKGAVVVPPFAKGDPGTDWNDYAQQHGDEAARKELERQVAQAKAEAVLNAERLMTLAREREAEARNDPTTSRDDALVAQERADANDLMARAVAGATDVRAAAKDALVAGATGKARPVAVALSSLAHTNEMQRDEVTEQRVTVHDGQNVSTDKQAAARAPTRRRTRGIDAGL